MDIVNIIIAVFFFGVLGCIYSYWNERITQVKSNPKYSAMYRSSITESRELGRFIKERGEETGTSLALETAVEINSQLKESGCSTHSERVGVLKACARASQLGNIEKGECVDFFAFVRLCHLKGCHVVVRQMGEEDLPRIEDKKRIIKEYRTGELKCK